MRAYFVKVGDKFVNVGGGHVVMVGTNGHAANSLVTLSTGLVIADARPVEEVIQAVERASAALFEQPKPGGYEFT